MNVNFQAIPTLKLLPILIAVLVTLVDIRHDKKHKSKWKRVWLPLILFSAACAACWNQYLDALASENARASERQRREYEAKQERDRTNQMNRIEGKHGDADATERYLRAVRELQTRYLADDTKRAAAKFFDSQEDRRKIRLQVQEANERLLVAKRPRYDPIMHTLTTRWDDWIAEFQKRGLKVEASTNDVPAIAIEPGRGWITIRHAAFPNKGDISIQVIPASIEEGSVGGEFLFIIVGGMPTGGAETWVHCQVTETQFRLSNPKQSRFLFPEYTGEAKYPVEDVEAMRALTGAIDEALTYLVIEPAK
jgi:hypothetical protein